MSVGNEPDRWEARRRWAAALASLRAEAGKVRPLTEAQICKATGVSSSTFSSWHTKGTAPKSLAQARKVTDFLEAHLGRRVRTSAQWDDLIKKAQQEADENLGRGAEPSGKPTRSRPLRYIHEADFHTPPELNGRQGDLDRLLALVAGRSGYLSLVAPPWAGKTAFLAAFAQRHVPADIDLVAYFVRWKARRKDTAADFRRTMVSVLGRYVAPTRRYTKYDRATLAQLYDKASTKSVRNGRKLLLLVDGLDGDVTECPRDEGIGSLLPQQPYPGLVVLVSSRWHPPLEDLVEAGHPLRDAEPLTHFLPSPEAAVRRRTVLSDLDKLLSTTWGQEIVGFLVEAGGGLTESDLMALVRSGRHERMPIPYDLTKLLNSVAGRGLAPEELEPTAFVLGHRDLYEAATDALGSEILAGCRERIHTWAVGYRRDGWPASTPGYLLHGYLDLLRDAGDSERRTAFTLDHRRLLRLAERGRVDLALASLDDLVRATAPAPAVLASVAASRALIEARGRAVPREVLRALCVVGDVERARSLALAPGDAVSKAARLLDVVRALMGLPMPEVREWIGPLAREAGRWAERARSQDLLTSPAAEWDALAVVPRTAVVLAEAGLYDAAAKLLRVVEVCRAENVEPAARCAALLREADPDLAEWVLEDLSLEADSQAHSVEGDLVFAVEIWAALAAHDPTRAERALSGMSELSDGVTMLSPDLTATRCCALTASALVRSAGEDTGGPAWNEARRLARAAWSGVRAALDTADPDSVGEALALVVRAHLDLGELHETVRNLLAEFPGEVTARAASLLDPVTDGDPVDAAAQDEAALLSDMERLSGLGDGPRLRSCLDRFTQAAAAGEGHDKWLPPLAEALASTSGDVDPALTSLVNVAAGPFSRVRVLSSAALAHAGARRQGEAKRCAVAAEAFTEGLESRSAEARALVAQAFAYAGEAGRAAQWATPPAPGKRPLGRAGIPYRRAALAVAAGSDPAAFISEVVSAGLPPCGFATAGTDLLEIFRRLAAGRPVDAQVAALRTVARARLATEPLLTTGLALVQVVRGDAQEVRRTVDEIPDAAARGVASAAVAGCLAGVPAHLDVAGDDERWTLSVLRFLAHHLRPAEAEGSALVRELTTRALETGSWYLALPVAVLTDPDAVRAVLDVLDRHRLSAA